MNSKNTKSRKYETLKLRQANEAMTGEIDSPNVVPSYNAIRYLINHNKDDESCLRHFVAGDVYCNETFRRVCHSSCSH